VNKINKVEIELGWNKKQLVMGNSWEWERDTFPDQW